MKVCIVLNEYLSAYSNPRLHSYNASSIFVEYLCDDCIVACGHVTIFELTMFYDSCRKLY